MITFIIALRSLLRRKIRVALIGLLVLLGTMLIVVGETISLSARHFSRIAIVNHFTGDAIIYSARSREKPSPFSFTTPLPIVADPEKITAWLDTNPLVQRHVAIAQNYGLMSVEKEGKKTDVPFIFYAVDPAKYRAMFDNIAMVRGPFFVTDNGPSSGAVLSENQAQVYAKNYGVSFEPGDKVTLLSISDGGSVNALPSKIVGIYKPKYFRNVFDYINFLDITSYSQLYNFTGVSAGSMPENVNRALASESDLDIFSLAKDTTGAFDTKSLVSQQITGYTMIAVRLHDPAQLVEFAAALDKQNFSVRVARWNEAAGFFAYVASVIQGVIYGAAFLIFLIVVFILMNTLIINVLERTGEIGTLRALGGEKSFITAIFLWESLLLNGAAALLGMVASFALIVAFGGGEGIVLPEVMQQYLIGGGGLPLLLTVRPFVEALGLILVVSVLATLYPIRVATAITPLKAMSGK
ncbi:MAG: FtsX-like permease family protein [Chitinispirillaceae bacterium]|nr:FtsX-like permease family protein [Chitinispirillaceae bacterium]